jgi:hypothetical protein
LARPSTRQGVVVLACAAVAINSASGIARLRNCLRFWLLAISVLLVGADYGESSEAITWVCREWRIEGMDFYG